MQINKEKNKYPYTELDLIRDNPQVSFPSEITEATKSIYSVFPVQPTPLPVFNYLTHKVVEDYPVEQNSIWVQSWMIVPLTEEELQRRVHGLTTQIVQATQERLDTFARTRNYDGILSACTYATSNVPKFSREGQAAVNLRDATWAALYQILEDVQTGKRNAPMGFQDIEADLPALEWPV